MSWILILAHLTIIEIAPLIGTQIIMSIETHSNNIRMGQLTEAAVIKKVSRRNYMIRCCGSESCRGPDYPRKTFVRTTTTTRNPLAVFQYQRPTRGRPVAVAEFSEEGFTISCPNCPLNWQQLLSFIPAPPGAIPLICPYCPTEWRDLLQIQPQTTTRKKQKKTTKASDDDEETDSTDTDSTDETEKLVVSTKPATTVNITTTLAPTTSTVTSTTTTKAATKVTKPPTTQPSFKDYGFKLD